MQLGQESKGNDHRLTTPSRWDCCVPDASELCVVFTGYLHITCPSVRIKQAVLVVRFPGHVPASVILFLLCRGVSKDTMISGSIFRGLETGNKRRQGRTPRVGIRDTSSTLSTDDCRNHTPRAMIDAAESARHSSLTIARTFDFGGLIRSGKVAGCLSRSKERPTAGSVLEEPQYHHECPDLTLQNQPQ